MDYGEVSQYRPDDASLAGTASTNPNIEMWGTGVGFRYTISPFVSIRFDYGWQLLDSGVNLLFRSGNASRGHLGVTVSY